MKLLLPIDGSDCSFETIRWASETLDKGTTEYYILQVVPSTHEIPTEPFEIDDAVKNLNRAQAELEQAGCKVIKAEYMTGDAVRQICTAADDFNVDQILMGSHGRTGLTKFLIGSVSSAVLENSTKPVFVYRNVKKTPAKIG